MDQKVEDHPDCSTYEVYPVYPIPGGPPDKGEGRGGHWASRIAKVSNSFTLIQISSHNGFHVKGPVWLGGGPP